MPSPAELNEFQDRHVLITGGSTGIGLATAELLARRGARVFLVARNVDKLAAAGRQIEQAGGTVAWQAADVAERAALHAAMQAAEDGFGPIDGLFANAGTGGTFAPLTEYRDDVFDTVIRTNVTSVYWALKRALGGMIARRRGSILITGSLASERGMPGNIGYVASKHAVLGLARAAAAEAASHQVRVNCVLPGFIETPMLMQLDPNAPAQLIRDRLGRHVPMGHIGSAAEAAELACFLLSDRSSHITGQTIAVDGGVLGTFIPR